MQGLPIEGGGFRGRSNKLVDGCYSWWIGGLEPLLLELLGLGNQEGETEVVSFVTEESDNESAWSDCDCSWLGLVQHRMWS